MRALTCPFSRSHGVFSTDCGLAAETNQRNVVSCGVETASVVPCKCPLWGVLKTPLRRGHSTVITHEELLDGRLFRIMDSPDAPSVARWFYDFEDIPHQIFLVAAALKRLNKATSKWSAMR